MNTAPPHPMPPHGAHDRVRAVVFDRDLRSSEIDPSALQAQFPLTDSKLVWVDVLGPRMDDALAATLGLDASLLTPPSVCVAGAALVEGWKYLDVVALDRREGQALVAVPLSLAVGPNVVVTLRAGEAAFLSDVLDNEADFLRVGKLDSMTFATALLDRMLTDYLDARDDFETILDGLELEILRRPDPGVLEDLQHLRRLASKLRQLLTDQRDLFDAIGRPDFDPGLSHEAARYCRQLRARYNQVTTSMEAARELVNGSFELYTSRVADNTNQTMHALTFITVVIGLLATVAGVMGMNFDAAVYRAGNRGFLATLAAMVAIALAALLWFGQRQTARTPARPRPRALDVVGGPDAPEAPPARPAPRASRRVHGRPAA